MSRSQASNAKAMQSKKWTICRIMMEGGTGDPKIVIWKPNSWAPASLALTFMVFPTIFQPPASSKQNTSQKHSFSPSKTLYGDSRKQPQINLYKTYITFSIYSLQNQPPFLGVLPSKRERSKRQTRKEEKECRLLRQEGSNGIHEKVRWRE